MRFNLNRDRETRDEFEAFVKSSLLMSLIMLDATTAQQLQFAKLEGWSKQTIDNLEWQLEVIKGEINNRLYTT